MENEESTPAPEVKASEPGVDSLLARREALIEKFNQQEEQGRVSEPVTKTEVEDTTEKESESSKEDVKDPVSEEASVKASDSKSDVPSEKQLLENKEKALQEERSKRKQAVLKARELEATFNSKLKELEEKLEKVQNSRTEEAQDDVSEEEQLKRKVAALEKEKNERIERERKEALVKQQQDLEKKIQTIDEKLEKSGYPGFDLATQKVQKAMLARLNDAELEPADLDNPDVWEKVFIEDVYPTLAKRFGIVKKAQTIEEKKAAKKNAGLASSSGKAPEKESDDEKAEPTMEDIDREYMKERIAQSRSLRK